MSTWHRAETHIPETTVSEKTKPAIVHVVLDSGDQFRYAGECAASEVHVGSLAKPALDQVQPGTGRLNEMQVEPLIAKTSFGLSFRLVVVTDASWFRTRRADPVGLHFAGVAQFG